MKKRSLPTGRHDMSPNELALKVGRENEPIKEGKRFLPERTARVLSRSEHLGSELSEGLRQKSSKSQS